tara:strand:- start:1103 stop:1318 length:216 start_codon:yes stop_codon:yes gene_type:complete
MAFKRDLTGGGDNEFAFQEELDKVKGGFRRKLPITSPKKIGIGDILPIFRALGFNKGGAVLKSRTKKTKYF